MQRPTSAINVLAVMSLWGACATKQNKVLFEAQSESSNCPFQCRAFYQQVRVCVQPSHHCLHSPCSQVSPTLSSWSSWRQRGGQGPGSQDLCWTSSNWQSVPSVSGIRDLTPHSCTKQYICIHGLRHCIFTSIKGNIISLRWSFK